MLSKALRRSFVSPQAERRAVVYPELGLYTFRSAREDASSILNR